MKKIIKRSICILLAVVILSSSLAITYKKTAYCADFVIGFLAVEGVKELLTAIAAVGGVVLAKELLDELKDVDPRKVQEWKDNVIQGFNEWAYHYAELKYNNLSTDIQAVEDAQNYIDEKAQQIKAEFHEKVINPPDHKVRDLSIDTYNAIKGYSDELTKTYSGSYDALIEQIKANDGNWGNDTAPDVINGGYKIKIKKDNLFLNNITSDSSVGVGLINNSYVCTSKPYVKAIYDNYYLDGSAMTFEWNFDDINNEWDVFGYELMQIWESAGYTFTSYIAVGYKIDSRGNLYNKRYFDSWQDSHCKWFGHYTIGQIATNLTPIVDGKITTYDDFIDKYYETLGKIKDTDVGKAISNSVITNGVDKYRLWDKDDIWIPTDGIIENDDVIRGKVGWDIPEDIPFQGAIEGVLPFPDVIGGDGVIAYPWEWPLNPPYEWDWPLNPDMGIDYPKPKDDTENPPTVDDILNPDIEVPVPTVVPTDPSIPIDPSIEIPETELEIKTFDLTTFFPFCIPFDILALFKALRRDVKREDLIFRIPFEYPKKLQPYLGKEYVFVFDLNDYVLLARVSRAMFTILFLFGLMKVTRNIIRG